jgi:CHAD domain-containing protein
MPQLRRTLHAMLDLSRHQMSSWPLQGATPGGLAAGFKRIYKRGRQSAKTARHNPSPENLHEWRKKAKDLGYAFELIENLCPGNVSRMIRRTNALTDALGDNHDLFLLLQAMRREHQSRPDGDFLKLSNRITARRAKLRKRAFKFGAKIYAERPAQFEKCIARLLQRRRNNHD